MSGRGQIRTFDAQRREWLSLANVRAEFSSIASTPRPPHAGRKHTPESDLFARDPRTLARRSTSRSRVTFHFPLLQPDVVSSPTGTGCSPRAEGVDLYIYFALMRIKAQYLRLNRAVCVF